MTFNPKQWLTLIILSLTCVLLTLFLPLSEDLAPLSPSFFYTGIYLAALYSGKQSGAIAGLLSSLFLFTFTFSDLPLSQFNILAPMLLFTAGHCLQGYIAGQATIKQGLYKLPLSLGIAYGTFELFLWFTMGSFSSGSLLSVNIIGLVLGWLLSFLTKLLVNKRLPLDGYSYLLWIGLSIVCALAGLVYIRTENATFSFFYVSIYLSAFVFGKKTGLLVGLLAPFISLLGRESLTLVPRLDLKTTVLLCLLKMVACGLLGYMANRNNNSIWQNLLLSTACPLGLFFIHDLISYGNLSLVMTLQPYRLLVLIVSFGVAYAIFIIILKKMKLKGAFES